MSNIRRLEYRLSPYLTALAVVILSLATYLVTITREVGWGDSAEFALQAFQLGPTHAPGYPAYILLGHMLTLLPLEPAIATNLLSAFSASIAVGILSLLVWHTTKHSGATAITPLVFAFTNQVWSKAVITEVYNTNVLIFGLSVFLIVKWYEARSFKYLLAAAICYGFSLGVYFANLLLVPAFLFFVYRVGGRFIRNTSVFALIVGASIGAVAFSSYLLSLRHDPMGSTYVPNSIPNILRYLTGAQYGTLETQDLQFYFQRLIEHSRIFFKNFGVVGVPIGLLGLLQQWKADRKLLVFFLLLFSINMGYFTGYRGVNFAAMTTPSYFVFTIWIGYGVKYLLVCTNQIMLRLALRVVVVSLVAGLLIFRLPERLAQARESPVTDFTVASFEDLPRNALVFARWSQFASLLYFQKTRGSRVDLTLIESSK